MSLSDEYARQLAWRPWGEVMATLPVLSGKTVLDLGCAIGDQTALLVAEGARVIGIDGNPELLAVARSRGIPNAEFRHGFLHAVPAADRALEDVDAADGIWCSFAAAYFPDLEQTLAHWKQHLRPGGWIALTEIDDFFAHEPVEAATRSLLDEYVKSALAAKRQDFLMGRKLRGHLEAAGFDVVKTGTVIDPELSFDGPAERDVLDAWRARLARMKLLQEQCGAAFDRVRDDFLAALSRDDHRCRAKVYYCIATLGRESEARSQG